MNEVRERLDRRASTFTPDLSAYDDIVRLASRRRLRRRLTAGFTAMVVSSAALVGLWFAARPDVAPVSAPTPGPAKGLRIGVETRANGWVVLPNAFGVWVAGADRLFDIHPQTGSVREVGRIDSDYDYVQLADDGEGTIWIASGNKLDQVDTSSGTMMASFDLSSLGTLDAVLWLSAETGRSTSGLWVTAVGEHGGVLAEVADDTGRVLRRISIGQGAHQLAVADDFVFVLSRGGSRPLVRVDPDTGDVTPVLGWTGTGFGSSIAGVGNQLWIGDETGVHCVLAATPAATCGDAAIPRAAKLAADGSDLWVLSDTGSRSSSVYLPDPNQPATVTLVDGSNGSVIAGPLDLPDTTPASIEAFDGSAWIGFHDSGRVVRIDTCAPDICVASARQRITRDLKHQIALVRSRVTRLNELLAETDAQLARAKRAGDMAQIARLNERIAALTHAITRSNSDLARLRQRLELAQASGESGS
jgi:hypothetical protein